MPFLWRLALLVAICISAVQTESAAEARNQTRAATAAIALHLDWPADKNLNVSEIIGLGPGLHGEGPCRIHLLQLRGVPPAVQALHLDGLASSNSELDLAYSWNDSTDSQGITIATGQRQPFSWTIIRPDPGVDVLNIHLNLEEGQSLSLHGLSYAHTTTTAWWQPTHSRWILAVSALLIGLLSLRSAWHIWHGTQAPHLFKGLLISGGAALSVLITGAIIHLWNVQAPHVSLTICGIGALGCLSIFILIPALLTQKIHDRNSLT